MTHSGISRVRYFPGQFLRQSDFEAEQAYHLQMRYRHNVGAHTWGIVQGLEIIDEEGEGPVIHPGMAIDGYGRELVLEEAKNVKQLLGDKIDRQFFENPPDKSQDNAWEVLGKRFDVFLQYSRSKSGLASGGYGRVEASVEPFYRWVETVEIVIGEGHSGTTDWRDPKEVSEESTDFAPTQPLMDDPDSRWWVFLGQLTQDAAIPGGFRIDSRGRPYAGIVAEAVNDPGGRGRIDIGADDGKGQSRFAVLLADSHTVHGDPARNPKRKGTEPGSLVNPAADKHDTTGRLRERLVISEDGTTTIHGKTQVHGDLTVEGPISFAGAAGRVDKHDPKSPTAKNDPVNEDDKQSDDKVRPRIEDSNAAWTIGYYRTESSVGSGYKSEKENSRASSDQLRIEMVPIQGEKPPEVVIGSWSSELSKFRPAMTIRANDEVVVHGNLIVEGLLTKEVGAQVTEKMPRTPPRVSGSVEAQMAGIKAGATSVHPAVIAALVEPDPDLDLVKMREHATIFGQFTIDALIALGRKPKTVKTLLRIFRYVSFVVLILVGVVIGLIPAVEEYIMKLDVLPKAESTAADHSSTEAHDVPSSPGEISSEAGEISSRAAEISSKAGEISSVADEISSQEKKPFGTPPTRKGENTTVNNNRAIRNIAY